MRHIVRWCACAAAAGPVPAALADGTLFLAEYKFNDPKLYSMGEDGSGLSELGIIPAADWLTVGLFVDADARKVYWVHGSFGQGAIRRANLDGSGLETLAAGLTNPRGLAVDPAGGRMYWSDTQDRALYMAGIDGSGITSIQTGEQYGHPTFDPDTGWVYYGNFDFGEIYRIRADGTGNERILAGVEQAQGIAVDNAAGKIYWTDMQTITNHIARANLDGTGVEVLVDFPTASSGLGEIRIDPGADAIFWIDEIGDGEKGVWTARRDGADPHRIYVSPEGWNAGALWLRMDADCPPDMNGDGLVNSQDFILFLNLFVAGDPAADFNGDGVINSQDFVAFLNAFVAGC